MTLSPHRIIALDLARTGALAAMVVFHTTYDLALFGHLARDTVFTGIWPYWARGTAGSFLFLAGVSLWLAHGQGIRWPAFGKRLALVAGGAALVSVGTYYGIGTGWIRFGILHSIALSSVIGLAALRLPPLATLGIAVVVFFAPDLLRSEAFNAPWLVWLGLATQVPPMADFEPILPWLAPLLAGVALAKAGEGWLHGLRGKFTGLAWLAWPGRHSLIIYLVHQPILFGVIWAVTKGLG
jgi:uncharacterized membrane protein